MALLHREKTGEGQIIDAALYESAFSFMENHVVNYGKLGTVAKRSGTEHFHSVVNNTFATKDGQFIHITASSRPVFKRLVDTMGRADLLEDERFNTPVARTQHPDALNDIVAKWIIQFNMTEVQKTLHDGDVPAMGIYTMADIYADPHFKARDMLVDIEDENVGALTVPGVVPKLSKTPGTVRHTGHRVGQDTRDVLSRLGKYSDEEIEALVSADAIFCG